MTDVVSVSGPWRTGLVTAMSRPGPDSVVLRLAVAGRPPHLPGQHYVVRLTAEDGYVAQRSYSLASPPADPDLEFWVARLDDGEVSPFLADGVRTGDELDVRGPIGGWFVWDGSTPAVGIGGGSGVVPLVAMLRHAAATGASDRLRLLAAARTALDVPYVDELAAAGAVVALSREARDGRPASRLTEEEIRAAVQPGAAYYVCGSTAFTEAVTQQLVDLGVPAPDVKVERFGPS